MNKKIIKYGSIIFGIILALCLICTILMLYFSPVASSRINDFKPLINEYTNIAQSYYNDYSKYNTESLVYSVPTSNSGSSIICYSDQYEHRFDLTADEMNNISAIQKQYRLDKQSLDYIAVYCGFVAFCNNNHRASYVYSLNNQKPEFISTPNNDNKKISVSKITDNWYFVSLMR